MCYESLWSRCFYLNILRHLNNTVGEAGRYSGLLWNASPKSKIAIFDGFVWFASVQSLCVLPYNLQAQMCNSSGKEFPQIYSPCLAFIVCCVFLPDSWDIRGEEGYRIPSMGECSRGPITPWTLSSWGALWKFPFTARNSVGWVSGSPSAGCQPSAMTVGSLVMGYSAVGGESQRNGGGIGRNSWGWWWGRLGEL